MTLDEVLATFRAIGEAQARFGEAACHRYVISFTAVAARRDGRARRSRAGCRRRRDGAADASTSCRCSSRARRSRPPGRSSSALLADPALPRPPRGPRRSPGGDARLLRLEQGIGVPGRGLAAPPGPGGAGVDGAPARRRADAVPRPRRRASAAAAARRTGRSSARRPGSVDGRLKLTEQGEVIAANYADPTIAAAPPRADDRRGPAGLDAGARRAARARPSPTGAPIIDELAATSRARLPRARPRRPGLRRVLPRHHADRASCPTCGSGRGRRRAGAARRGAAIDRLAARDPVDLRLVAVADQPARLVRPRHRARGVPGRARRGRARRDRAARTATGRSSSSLLDNAEMSLAKADMGVARLYAALAHERRRRPAAGTTIEAEYRRTVALLAPGHRPRPAARRRAGPPALDRAAQPVRRLAVGAPGPAARPAARARTRRPRARTGPAARPADRQRRGGRTAEHRLR